MQSAPIARSAANTPRNAQARWFALDRDGAVRAMIGGRDYVDSLYNRATQAQRQPGSAFKLFVYLAALESGMKPTDTIVDEPIEIDGWRPRNSTRTHQGAVDLREAFSRSINTVSAKIGANWGFRDDRRYCAAVWHQRRDFDLPSIVRARATCASST